MDNPPAESLHYISNMLQIMGHFMESLLKMRNLVKNLERMSYLDQLTQIGNRYAMVKYTEGMRPGESVGIVYGDITGLKRVNDAEGHEAGDHLILAASACMKEAFSGTPTSCSASEETNCWRSVRVLERRNFGSGSPV